MSAVPMGFVLVVGFAVVLLASLQILILAHLVDAAKGVQRLVELATPQPIHFGLTREDPALAEKLREELGKLAHSGDA